jgi:predicted  nucleic acid-binding Zn-ribbon protein
VRTSQLRCQTRGSLWLIELARRAFPDQRTGDARRESDQQKEEDKDATHNKANLEAVNGKTETLRTAIKPLQTQLKRLETELGIEKNQHHRKQTSSRIRLQTRNRGFAQSRLADLMTSFHNQKEEILEQVHQQMVPEMLVRAPSRI